LGGGHGLGGEVIALAEWVEDMASEDRLKDRKQRSEGGE
jgi:hypothetical protein